MDKVIRTKIEKGIEYSFVKFWGRPSDENRWVATSEIELKDDTIVKPKKKARKSKYD